MPKSTSPFSLKEQALNRFASPQQLGNRLAKLLGSRDADEAKICAYINAGADITHLNNSGWPPLLLATHNGYTKALSLLIEKGADVHFRGPSGNNALNTAVSPSSNKDCVRLLIAAGAELENRDMNGKTPLQASATYGTILSFQLLLAAGAETDPMCTPKHTVDALLENLVDDDLREAMKTLLKNERKKRTDREEEQSTKEMIERIIIITSVRENVILTDIPKLKLPGAKKQVAFWNHD